MEKLRSNEKLALQMIEIWGMGEGNPLRKTLKNHPNDTVKSVPDYFDGMKSVLAESYGFDAYNLPDNF